ncbi:MAG: helix-turn-helix transcriptional regulator [Candidatus Faecousia sp.]|nr:helix-turn-helix transcriptional regulator [Candidatus Faecousia sp.]
MENNVRYWREYQGISQRELARIVGVTSGEISGIERGVYLPNVVTAILIARALGVPVEKLWEV